MTGEEEKYTTLSIEQCKWWVNHLFSVAKEQAFNGHLYDDALEIQSAQDKIIQVLEQEPCEKCVSLADVYEIMGNLMSIPYDFDRNITEQDVSESMDKIRELPKGQLKTGHWIVDGSVDCYLDKVRCHCSECGIKKNFPADYNHINQELYISYKHPELIDNYCSNCGVKMIRMSEVKND